MVIKTLQNLSAPEESGCIFTSPDFKNWQSLIDANKDSLAGIDNRNISRDKLVNIAAEYTRRMALSVPHLKSGVDIIVTGHQPNWHHCGILAKNIVTDGFARQTGGTAVQLVLDHDICGTSITLPEYDSDDCLRFKTIPLKQKQPNIPLELRPVPNKEQLTRFIDSVSKIIKGSFCSDIWHQNLSSVLKDAQSCMSVADIITQLQARLNQTLGLEMIYLPVSLMSESDSFTDFVCSIICDAVSFAGIYNQAISNQRQTHNLKPNQTIRPLKADYLNNIIELPFWLVSESGKRASLYASFNDRSLHIGTADYITGTIDSSGPEDRKQQLLEILRKNNYTIRPKAVTLTLFVRLFFADWFIHGTGAGNYEHITDYLIRHYYKISRLDFGVATATMTLPIQRKNVISKEIVNYREFFFGLFKEQELKKLISPKEAEDEDSINYRSSS